ncbi:unnamed protein product [Musa acuminata subsp. malaccensis]|uniref:(wild Malaysian banana) hypothetical protein n=1 Tax=Musa acuminata subsp. malaccensis TaxID=214687 RepID=A0A804KQK6_MUSAM|nr:PREDICTED: CRS2-associated factor 2, mitochondrial-like isoform X2 [Musa acuminata subsp. malaccensis]CAG1836979.1 unnamed protein product [Musa acuminata subsp. malaccensis]
MWRRLLLSVTVPLRTRTLISPPLLSSPSHHLLSRSNKHSASPHDDPHDPPFSPIAKAPNPKPKQSPKARNPKPKQAPKALPSGMDKPSLPLHSDLPFDFRYSYSETDPSLRPIGYREPPRFSPFGPGRLDRKWDGVSAPATGEAAEDRVSDDRSSVLGDPLTEEEVGELVERYRHSDCSRQINLGTGGVTHNTLEDIHNHWKRAEAVRIKCLGVPTIDMDNVCFHLEDKTGGKIIYRHINILLLYRGRNYDPKQRPVIPLMLWKPLAPIYPRLVPKVAEGLTFEQTKELRNRGLNTPALMKLTRNGVYANVVERVREAFRTSDVVRLDCAYVYTSDCKKIGVKLRDLVPCIPILFKDRQIIIWRGRETQDSDQCDS